MTVSWWHDLAPTLTWRWATTYADTFPHSYVVKGRNVGSADYDRLFDLIWTQGEPHMFFRRINIELHCPELTMEYRGTTVTGFKFWPMSAERAVSRIINMAPLAQVYGDQSVAPVTRPAQVPVPAAVQDLERGRVDWVSSPQNTDELWRTVIGDTDAQSVLEVGAMTGQAPMVGMIGRSTRYRAVEESQTLLNQLVYREQFPHSVINANASTYLNSDVGQERFDVVVSLFGQASRLSTDEIERLISIAEKRAVLMFEPDDRRFELLSGYPTLVVTK